MDRTSLSRAMLPVTSQPAKRRANARLPRIELTIFGGGGY